MIFIGESINTSFSKVEEAVKKRDAAYIRRLARTQAEKGAHYVGINCGTMLEKETEIMEWLVNEIQQEVDIPLSIDTPNAGAMEIGLSLARTGIAIMDSITAEKERFQSFLPIIDKYKPRIIGLLMNDNGIPPSASGRLEIAREMISDLLKHGVDPDDIIVDPIVKPIGVSNTAGMEVLESLRAITREFPSIHLSIGLSNISHAMPMKEEIDISFLVMCIQNGLDYCIANVLDSRIPAYAACAEALAGKDPYCSRLLKLYRKGFFPEGTDFLEL